MPSAGLADDNTAVTRTLGAIEACRAIVSVEQRVACYDKAAESISAARRNGELIVLDRSKVVERRRAQFGLVVETDAGLGGEADVKQLETTVRKADFVSRTDKWMIELANGTVWTTLAPLRFDPKPGAKITVRKAPLGAFRAEIGHEVVPVKRVR